MRDDLTKLGLKLDARYFYTDKGGNLQVNKDFAIYVINHLKWKVDVEVTHVKTTNEGGMFVAVKARMWNKENELIPGIASSSNSLKQMDFASLAQKAGTFAIKQSVEWNLGLDAVTILELATEAGVKPGQAAQKKYNAFEAQIADAEDAEEEIDLGSNLEV